MFNRLKQTLLYIVCLSGMCRFGTSQGLIQALGDSALHLVAVIPSYDSPDSFDPQIYRLNAEGGRLQPVYMLKLDGEGLDFTRADFRSRRLVFAWPRVVPANLCIVNMDAVGSPVKVPLELSDVPASAWSPLPADYLRYDAEMAKPSAKIIYDHHPTLVGMPGVGGHWLALRVTTFRGNLIAGYRLDMTPQREILDSAAMSHLRVQGDFGLARELGESDAQLATIRDGKVFVGLTDIGVPAPGGTDDPKAFWRLVAHDGTTTIMYRLKDPDASSMGDGASRLYIRNGSSAKWRILVVPGSQPRVKMIDSWVMGEAASDDLGRESPGASERRRYHQRYREEAARNRQREGRLATDQVFGAHKSYFPGILFLINAATARYFEIRTGQGDSEILLVHQGTVYYRVNDSLFAAPLKEDSIGPSRLLARDDVIPDVHWAFWGR